MFNIDEIREMIKLVEQSSLQRFELEQESAKLVMVKQALPEREPALTEPCTLTDTQKPVAFENREKVAETTTAALQDHDLYKILSPVVGTFYASPEPGADAFVKVGQKVTAGAVVCIVEVMKLFNEVEAEREGEIAEILVKDGDFVEYGQPLFLVKPE